MQKGWRTECHYDAPLICRRPEQAACSMSWHLSTRPHASSTLRTKLPLKVFIVHLPNWILIVYVYMAPSLWSFGHAEFLIPGLRKAIAQRTFTQNQGRELLLHFRGEAPRSQHAAAKRQEREANNSRPVGPNATFEDFQSQMSKSHWGHVIGNQKPHTSASPPPPSPWISSAMAIPSPTPPPPHSLQGGTARHFCRPISGRAVVHSRSRLP